MYQFAMCQDEDHTRPRRRGLWIAGTIIAFVATVAEPTGSPFPAVAQEHWTCDVNDTLCVSECGKARIAIMRGEAAVEAGPHWRGLVRTAPFLHFTAVVKAAAKADCGEPYGANEALWHIYEAGLGNPIFPAVGGPGARCAGWRSNLEECAQAVFLSPAWPKVEGSAVLAALRDQVLELSRVVCPAE